MSIPVLFTDEPPKLHASTSLKPGSGCVLEYLNEGGANIVFKILPEIGKKDLPNILQGKLLRLRKDLPHVQNPKEQLAAFDEHFRPLFPTENLIQHQLIQLSHGLTSELNATLRKLVRPSHRVHDFLPDDETHGLLVTDMTPHLGDVLLQVKPKWLNQSPNAPPEAKRCRTCALRAQRASQHIRTATDAQESCSLELISYNENDRKRAAASITNDKRLQEYLVSNAQTLLQIQRENQVKLDAGGILNAKTAEQIMNLCKAMTLRDCTLFLKRSGNTIQARFADLDLKTPEKLSRWKKVEQDLVTAGWYTNMEDKAVWKKEKVCLLAR